MDFSAPSSLLVLVLTTVLVAGGPKHECEGPGPYSGWWSKSNVLLCRNSPPEQPIEKDRHLTIQPRGDRRLAVAVDGIDVHVQFASSVLKNSEPIQVLWPAELSWSPGALRFQVTAGTATTTGFSTQVYRVDTTLMRVIPEPDFNRTVRSDFEAKYPCDENAANVYAINWLTDDELAVVAQSPDRGGCEARARALGYVIAVETGKILRKMSAREVKTRWGSLLGSELRYSVR